MAQGTVAASHDVWRRKALPCPCSLQGAGARLFRDGLPVKLVIRAFAPTVAFGLIGGIAGLMATAQGVGYAFPYSLLCIGMRANNPNMELDFAPFLLSAFVYTAVFTLLAVHHLRRHDVAAE